MILEVWKVHDDDDDDDEMGTFIQKPMLDGRSDGSIRRLQAVQWDVYRHYHHMLSVFPTPLPQPQQPRFCPLGWLYQACLYTADARTGWDCAKAQYPNPYALTREK